MSKKKIYFYGFNRPVEFTGDKNAPRVMFYNTVPIILDAFVRRTDPELHAQIEWAELAIFEKSTPELIQELNDLDIDMLCVSLYVWNVKIILDSIKNIKQHLNKKIKIIAGGPSVDIYRNRNFLLDNPDIDYAIYTQGEHAFLNVLESVVRGKKLNTLNTKNLAWVDDNKQVKISNFEFVKNTEGSPYLESQDLLLRMKNETNSKGYDLTLPYETSRGCPHKCSFCDWTSGLTHKVSKREFDYEEELDFLGRNGIINLQMSDANFGILKRDLDIAKTLVRLKAEKGYQYKIWGNNFNKSKKDIVFEIIDLLLGSGILISPKISVQDVNPDVLKNIDRPDIPWKEHRVYIEKMKEKYPDVDMRVELILGLPGQTCESWENTLIETYPFRTWVYPLSIIPNSPMGYDLEYREKMKFKTLWSNTDSLNESYNIEIVIETYSYTFDDYTYNMLLAILLNRVELREIKDRREFFNRVKISSGLADIKAKIKAHVENSTIENIKFDISKFILSLYKDFTDWPEEIDKKLKEFIRNDYYNQKRNIQTQRHIG